MVKIFEHYVLVYENLLHVSTCIILLSQAKPNHMFNGMNLNLQHFAFHPTCVVYVWIYCINIITFSYFLIAFLQLQKTGFSCQRNRKKLYKWESLATSNYGSILKNIYFVSNRIWKQWSDHHSRCSLTTTSFVGELIGIFCASLAAKFVNDCPLNLIVIKCLYFSSKSYVYFRLPAWLIEKSY